MPNHLELVTGATRTNKSAMPPEANTTSLASAIRQLAAWLISVSAEGYGHATGDGSWEFPSDFTACFGYRQYGDVFELFVQPQEGAWLTGADGFYLRAGTLNLCFGRWLVFALPLPTTRHISALSIRSTVPPYISRQEGIPLVSPWLSAEDQAKHDPPYVLFTPRSGQSSACFLNF